MKGLNQTGRFFETIVNVLFGILVILILCATVALDKTVDVTYPNTVPRPNAAYYLLAALLLLVLFRSLFVRRQRTGHAVLTPRRFYCALISMALVVAVLQFFVARWVPLPHDVFNSDFKQVMDTAEKIANGGSFKGVSYFQRSPNNLNITIVVSWAFRILHSQRAVIWLNALLVNISMVLTSLAVLNFTGRKDLALVVAALGEVLVALTWRAFLVYSDSFAMFFLALVVWLYTSSFKPAIKIPLIALCAACAYYIKVTALIVPVALAINGLIRWLRGEDHKLDIRSMALYIVSVVVMFGAVFAMQGPIRRHYGYVPGEYPKGLQYMLMVGQNTDRVGAAGGNNNSLRKRFIEEFGDSKEVNQAFFNQAMTYVRERGVSGNVKFYLLKLTQIYNDGYFHNVQSDKIYEMDKTFLYNLYVRRGKYYQITAAIFQVLWDTVLLVMMAYTLYEFLIYRHRRKERRLSPDGRAASVAGERERCYSRSRDIVRFSKLTLLGITMYLLILEGRAKYLYMYMPVIIMAFGVMFQNIGMAASDMLGWMKRGRAAEMEQMKDAA